MYAAQGEWDVALGDGAAYVSRDRLHQLQTRLEHVSLSDQKTSTVRQATHYNAYCNTRCNSLQRNATCWNMLQHAATCCIGVARICLWQVVHTAAHCNSLQLTATHCNSLQLTATHCNPLHHRATKRKQALSHRCDDVVGAWERKLVYM